MAGPAPHPDGPALDKALQRSWAQCGLDGSLQARFLEADPDLLLPLSRALSGRFTEARIDAFYLMLGAPEGAPTQSVAERAWTAQMSMAK